MTTYLTEHGSVQLEVPDEPGMTEIVQEVIENDCYGLNRLKKSGYEIRYALDVGAHIGTFAVMLKLLWPDAAISCFEPNPELATICKRNAPWANVVQAAVRYDGLDKLFVPSTRQSGCIYEPTVNFDDNIPNQFTKMVVPTIKLDGFITTPVDLLKLDCEGSEFHILSSLSRDCIRNVRRIVGEYHHIAGFRFVEQIINLRYKHLKVRCVGDPNQSQGIFYAE